MTNKIRRTGIELIGDAPWGTHFCQFYNTKQDLIDILVPYFRQGLADNEFCMWITSEPLSAAEAKTALREAVPQLDEYIRDDRIEILNYTEWYTKSGSFNADDVLQGWVDKLEDALKRGYEGLRLTGNTFWLEDADWAGFTAYEEAVNKVIGSYNMLAVCTYSLEKCGAPEIMDVMSNHKFALVKRGNSWQMIDNCERQMAEAAFAESEQRYSSIFKNAPFAMSLSKIPRNTIAEVNNAFLQLFEFSREEVIGKTSVELGIADPDSRAKVGEILREKGFVRDVEVARRTKTGREIFLSLNVDWVEFSGERFLLTTIRDITERKRVETMLLAKEEELQLVADFTPMVLTRLNRDMRYIFANQSCCRLLNRPLNEILGKSAPEIMGDQAFESIRPYIDRVLLGETVVYEMEIPYRDAGKRFMHVTYIPDKNSHGEVVGWFASVLDITDRKQTELAFRESEAKLSRVLKSIQDDFYVLDRDWRFVFTSRSFTAKIGKEPKDFIGKNIWEMFPKHIGTALEENFRASMEKGEIRRFETGGKYTSAWYSMSSFPSPEGITVLGRDISLRKKAEQALQESSEEIERFNRLMIGRESRMIELKEEVNELCKRMGLGQRYPLEFEKLEGKKLNKQ
ncbi:MAG: MEDS domain-containing protein [Spirochaetota bacterium]